MKNNDSNKGAIIQVEEYNIIGNFTQLVTAPICDDDSSCWRSVLVCARWLGGILLTIVFCGLTIAFCG